MSEPWTSGDEETAILEISEDRRLRRLGIDPDLPDPVIYLELLKRAKQLDDELAGKRSA
jgi:hypothetical protein